MNTQSLIPVVIAAVGTATALNVLLKRLNMPTVIGYILTGAIIGMIFQIDAKNSKELQHIAEFGIVFLMFTIGLEFSFSHLGDMKREVFLLGTLQVLLSAGVIGYIGYIFFGLDLRQAIVIGSALALSSTAIVLKILNETGKMKSPLGRNALGILIFQDIAVIPILLMIAIFTAGNAGIGSLLGAMLLNTIVVVGSIFFVGRFLLGHLFRMVSDTNSKEIYIGSILLTVLGASYLAHHFGLSYSLGGFLAGMMIAETIYRFQVEADLIPFRDLLLGVFFVSVGLQLDPQIVMQNIGSAVILSLGLMSIKFIVLFSILAPALEKQLAMKTSLTLAQVGEFSLVVLSIVLANGLLKPESAQVLILAVILSMIATPFLISQADAITSLLFNRSDVPDPYEGASLVNGHVVILGYGYFGQLVSSQLDGAGIDHVIVTDNSNNYMDAREAEKMVVYGDPADKVLLSNIGIQHAMSTIVALDSLDTVKRACASISLVDPNVEVIAKVPTESDRQELEDFDLELVLDGSSQTAGLIVDQINQSRLLAKEMSNLRYIDPDKQGDPDEAIEMISLEQKRLLDLIAESFNGMRQGRDIMSLKALHESFAILSEILKDTINKAMDEPSLTAEQYERINILLENQSQLVAINAVLDELSRELKRLLESDGTKSLAKMAIEGLDTLLMTLTELAEDFNELDMEMLHAMTSDDGKGLARIRKAYLDTEMNLEKEEKAALITATNTMDRLRGLFGKVGHNYKRLARIQASTM